jgi:arginyl-tRNA synthetase
MNYGRYSSFILHPSSFQWYNHQQFLQTGDVLMKYALDRFADEIRQAVAETGLVPVEQIELTEPKAPVPADLALPCFRAAKSSGMAPPQLAQQLASALQFPSDSLVGNVQATGPFLNFTLNRTQFVQQVLAEVEQYGECYGDDELGQDQTVIIEYSSPNIAKRMHVGHIRSTIIGQAINNIFGSLSYRTIADNHLGDYGKQFGTMIAAMMRWGKPSGEGEALLAEIEALYTRYSQMVGGSADAEDLDADALDDEARAWSLKLEQGDPTARELWQWLVDTTLQAIQRSYDRLGVQFNTQHGESFYADMLPIVIGKAEDQGLAEREPSGALAVKGLRDQNNRELPSFLLQRSDGATLYLTRDVATVIYREQEYHPAKIIYVVGQEQELHFRQVFALVRAMGYAQSVELTHVPFGRVFTADGQPLSTRKGNMVYLEALLDDAKARAKAVIQQKIEEGKTDFTPEQIDQLAEAVGVGAVIYNDLYQDPKRNITLDWNRMLSFEGNSAPYLQYTHARCCSILREAGTVPSDYDSQQLTAEQELAVIKQLARLPAIVRRAGESYAPYVIAEWLYTTAREFARFYRDLSVLRAETPELRAARLHLVAATAQALRNGLQLLSIQAPERM